MVRRAKKQTIGRFIGAKSIAGLRLAWKVGHFGKYG
jgi:hypothetical protein